ncbi:helix-turn-helix transcriptional regulator [Chitinophagaceae bacterium LB-8]|uniref:Helix-turn-helix transcriptional regulator n=1 Tax=Paraflavisolibacter caeni TaxID=2982496 RepID=A0A9X3B751_9BACT|nr:helix-turn-helix domain-containing protein [Paraflavisolibacter caeni]MCU7548840.1 helix-turn-helix transcriptional regulator [Paraflavisolibacter caeni]
MAITNKDRKQIAAVFSGTCSRKKLCPVKDFMASFSDKWSIYTILLLGQHQKMRFNELRTAINGISQRMLTVTLRALQENGIVARLLYPEIPPRVEYSLTGLGEGLLKQLLQIAKWTEENFETMLKARKKYEKTL